MASHWHFLNPKMNEKHTFNIVLSPLCLPNVLNIYGDNDNFNRLSVSACNWLVMKNEIIQYHVNSTVSLKKSLSMG